VIDMGPEAGDGGGRIVAEGPPEDIVVHAERWASDRDGGREAGDLAGGLLRSHTGEALAAFAPQPATTAPRGRW